MFQGHKKEVLKNHNKLPQAPPHNEILQRFKVMQVYRISSHR